MRHPRQPVVMADDGIVRFRENAIVRHLLNTSRTDLHQLSVAVAHGEYSEDDYAQLLQLIGYSVSGYGSLSVATPEEVAAADAEAETFVARGGRG